MERTKDPAAPTKARVFHPRREPLQRFAAAGLAGIAIVALGVQLYFNPGAWDRAWPKLLEYSIAFPLFAWIHHAWVTGTRLVVDDRGIRLTRTGPTSFGLAALRRPWSVEWDEVKTVTARPEFGIVQIRRKGAALPLGLQVWQWEPEDGKEPRKTAGFFTFKRPDARDSVLWKVLESRGLFAPGRFGAGTTATDFDMAKHPATRAVLWVTGIAFVYAVADLVLTSEHWAAADLGYLAPHLAVAGVAALSTLVVLALARTPMRVPAANSLTLAVLCAVSVGLASRAALVHVDQAIGGPLEPHPYVRNDRCDALLPVEAGLPTIEFGEGARQYWCRIPKAQVQDVLLRKVPGGLYLVDVSKQNRAIRDFNGR